MPRSISIYQVLKSLVENQENISKPRRKRYYRYLLTGDDIWSDQGWFLKVLTWDIQLQEVSTAQVVAAEL